MSHRCDDSADPTVATFRRLLRTSLSMKRAMGALFAEAGLTGAQFHTLVRIPDDGIPLTRLAARSWADPGNASGVVDRLERDGLVERQGGRPRPAGGAGARDAGRPPRLVQPAVAAVRERDSPDHGASNGAEEQAHLSELSGTTGRSGG